MGAPRSGTTYVQEIIDTSPQTILTNESRIFSWMFKIMRAEEEDPFVPFRMRHEFINHIRRSRSNFIRDFYGSLDPKARFWGDKNPHYAENPNLLQTIEEMYPKTHFVHIIRDGRDVVTSLVQMIDREMGPWADFEQAHEIWLKHVLTGRSFGQKLPQGQYYELHYEKLVQDDVNETRKLFKFLGIPFHAKVEAFCASQQNHRTPLSDPTRNLQLGAATSKWSEIFSPRQQKRSLKLLSPTLQDFGYSLTQSNA